MKCSTCGTNLEPGDAFCPECGTKAAPAQAAAKPAAPPPAQHPKQPAAAAPPPQYPKQPAAAAEDEEILPVKKKKEKKEKKQKPPKEPKTPKAPRAPKAPKDPNAKKKPVVLLIVLLVVAAGAAAFMTFGNKPSEPPMPMPNSAVRPAAQRPASAPAARAPRTGDIQEPGVDKFAARICRNSMSDVKAVDDLTSFEFIARISADPAALAAKKIDMRDYVSAAADAVRADIEKQGMKPCESCNVALAKEMECGQVLGALGSVLVKENLLKNTSEIRPAAAETGVANCGVFVLEQKWPGAASPSQVAYFTGEINGRRSILFYAATSHFASEIASQ